MRKRKSGVSMDDAKGVKHSADCERTQFIKELKTLKQRTSELRCQIGALVVVSERMEMEEKRCGQLQRRLKCCDTRVAELEEKLWSRTQEVNLARETYRMLRKDLAQFNQNLTTTCDDDDSASSSKRKSLIKSGGKRKRKEEEEEGEEESGGGKASLFKRSSDCSPSPDPKASSVRTNAGQTTDQRADQRTDRTTAQRTEREDCLSQQPRIYGDETVKAKRRKKTDKKQEKGAGKEEKGDRQPDDRKESTVTQTGRQERGEGKGGGGGGQDCCEEAVERKEMTLTVKKCSSYVLVNDCSSMVETAQPKSVETAAVKRKSSCPPSIRISEVHPRGHYIRIINTSKCQEEDLGNHFLLQRYQDTPFTVFRFPSSVCLQPLGVATVWSASGAAEECCAGRQLPSSDFIFSSQPIWASGPECITILCKPNEQALKWLSSSPLSKRSDPSSTPSKPKSRQQQQQQQHQKGNSYLVYRAEDDCCRECQQPRASGSKNGKGGASETERGGKRQQVGCSKTASDSSPERRPVQRRRGTTCGEEKEQDVEGRRRKTGEARKRKKKEEVERRKKEEEEECLGCEEEIRLTTRRLKQAEEKEERRTKRQTSRESRGGGGGGGEEEEDSWIKAVAIMDKKIPCTSVHIEDGTTSPTAPSGRKDTSGGGTGGGGGCVEERSDCGESKDCSEVDRRNSVGSNCNSLINSKIFKVAMCDSNHDDDCGGGCGGSSKQKKLSHGSMGRCTESSDGSSKDCNDQKEARTGGGRGGRGGCRGRQDAEENTQARKTGGGCCGSQDEDDDDDDCDDGGQTKKEKRVVGSRRSKCEECNDGRKKEEDESIQEKWNRPTGCGGCGGGRRGGGGGCGGGGGRGGGGSGRGGEGGCGGGAKRRTKEWKEGCKEKEDCCKSEKGGSWSRWTNWLSDLVSGSSKENNCGDQPTFSSSAVNCLDQRNMADAEVHCIDQVFVREKCPTYRPRLDKGAQCRSTDGCPACPPNQPGCNEAVGITERSRPKKRTTVLPEKKECKCDGAQLQKKGGDPTQRNGCVSSSRSDGCLQEASATTVCECWCHLDSMALTAASVMAAGLTVAAIYCH